MPVFARTKLMMEERCLTYRPRIEFNFSGPNPQKAYERLLEILIKDLQIPRGNVQEKLFKWDRTKPEESFTAEFEAIKDFDKFSYMFLLIKLSGRVKPSKEFGKEGSVSIVMEGMVRTEYPQDTTWERSFLYEMFRTFYHKVFYKDQREKYTQQCRDWMYDIENNMKSFFGILSKG